MKRKTGEEIRRGQTPETNQSREGEVEEQHEEKADGRDSAPVRSASDPCPFHIAPRRAGGNGRLGLRSRIVTTRTSDNDVWRSAIASHGYSKVP